MIESECHWITAHLGDLQKAKILDIGGGTPHHRFRVQPFIAYELYRPLLATENRLFVFERALIQRKKDILFSVPLEFLAQLLSPIAPLRRRLSKILPLAPTLFGDCEAMGLAEQSFDGIFMLSLFEHVTNPQRALAQGVRTLKRGGFAFVSVPEICPYHPAPIDTGLRMSPAKLASFVSPFLTVLDQASLADEPSCRVSILYARKPDVQSATPRAAARAESQRTEKTPCPA